MGKIKGFTHIRNMLYYALTFASWGFLLIPATWAVLQGVINEKITSEMMTFLFGINAVGFTMAIICDNRKKKDKYYGVLSSDFLKNSIIFFISAMALKGMSEGFLSPSFELYRLLIQLVLLVMFALSLVMLLFSLLRVLFTVTELRKDFYNDFNAALVWLNSLKNKRWIYLVLIALLAGLYIYAWIRLIF